MTDKRSQSDKFKDAARELSADEDEKRWEERLRKVVKPGKGRNIGDDTPNPLPDDYGSDSGNGNGDPGRI